jgi:hypothetical protein
MIDGYDDRSDTFFGFFPLIKYRTYCFTSRASIASYDAMALLSPYFRE